MFKFIFNLNQLINFPRFRRTELERGVDDAIKCYGKTLELLEKYDRGEVSKPEDLARHKSLPKYLRTLQKQAEKDRKRTTS